MSRRVLLIDAGNTNVKWCLADDSGYGDIRGISHLQDDFTKALDSAWSSLPRPDNVYLASVAGPEVEWRMLDWVNTHWGLRPELQRARASALGVTSAYSENPQNLGVDRWLTLLAAHARGLGNCCIVDAGTAITIDLLGANGEHYGGLILPGLKLMGDSLLQRTHIPRVAPDLESGLLAKDTSGAVANAACYSAVALVEKVMLEAESRFGAPPLLLLAGSDARLMSKLLSYPFSLEPDLVIQGLYQLARAEGF